MEQIRAVLFEIDKTIKDLEAAEKRHSEAAWFEIDSPMTEAIIHYAVALALQEVSKAIKDHYSENPFDKIDKQHPCNNQVAKK